MYCVKKHETLLSQVLSHLILVICHKQEIQELWEAERSHGAQAWVDFTARKVMCKWVIGHQNHEKEEETILQEENKVENREVKWGREESRESSWLGLQ